MTDLDRYLTDEIVGKAAKAMADDWDPERSPVLAAMFRDYAQTALSAVLPDIIRQVKAEAWDEGHLAGHEDARAVQPTYPQPTRNPYADEHDACCPHPKCPGGGLCCCLPEQGGQP